MLHNERSCQHIDSAAEFLPPTSQIGHQHNDVTNTKSPTQSHQHNDVINITVTIEMSLLYEISLFKNYEKPTFEIWNLILGIFCVFIWFFILHFRFFLNGMAFKNRYRASFFSRIQIKYA